ncbi:MAG: ATP-dependent DNA helicase RecG [Phototrophicaceae bacterium]
MPSALETLVKILKLEREQGCENRAVIGGLRAYSVNWKIQAQAQARRPEHHVLAEELTDLLNDYEHLDGQLERMRQIDYMLDRIVGREPIPDTYKHLLDAAPKPEKKKQSPKKEKQKSEPPPKAKVVEESPDPIESYGYDNFQPVDNQERDIPEMPRLARPPRKRRDALSIEEARQRLNDLEKPTSTITGVGQSKADDLSSMGIETVDEMLRYLPRRYDDYTQLRYISQLEPAEVVTVIGTVSHTEVRTGKNNRKDFFMVIDDGSGQLNALFFGQHFLIRSIRKGQQLVLSGKASIWGNRLQMSNPEWESLDSENLHTVGIVPVYRLTEGVKARGFRRLMKKTVDQFANKIPDHIPEAVLDRAELADIGWTIENLHFPAGFDHLQHARRRYIFDQLITLQLGILRNRRDWQAVPSEPITVDDAWLDSFLDRVFPYTLTGAQLRALQEIREDIAKNVPMNRLLQGDVGAGKTAVAVASIGMALINGKQAALMAPTGILAEQHYRGISQALEDMPIENRPVIALLTGALTQSERNSVYRGLDDGSIDLVIGTHAIIQDGVQFNDLGIAIIDEQHRFGVEQRAALRGKGSNPHLLVMTATPIPRTLALTMYADLDLSILDEKPPGRQPIDTKMLEPVVRERAINFIEKHLETGRQAFIIHPLVEASDKIEARSAVEAYDELSQVFYKYRVCLLHGRMSAKEKDEIMAAFANHEYDVMVTTSVAEVGVDVPNANIIMIEGANRFGLSQLHQFRGRVGRGEHKSFCLLIPDSITEESERRLKIMESTDDGFILAEEDWKMRGAGDLLGTRQSGTHILQLAEEMTPELVKLAQQEALTIYAEDPYLEQEQHLLLAEKVTLLMNRDGGDVS